ncbi:hypothetical protein D3C84_433690 [compost metagenome]
MQAVAAPACDVLQQQRHASVTNCGVLHHRVDGVLNLALLFLGGDSLATGTAKHLIKEKLAQLGGIGELERVNARRLPWRQGVIVRIQCHEHVLQRTVVIDAKQHRVPATEKRQDRRL